MSSTLDVILSRTEEDAVRSLHKTLRATRYDDANDQKKFLEQSAHTLLIFADRPSSFAMSTDLGECVFLIRTEMHKNNIVLSSPSSDLFRAIADFAGKVARKRIELFRNLKFTRVQPLTTTNITELAKASDSAHENLTCTPKTPTLVADDDSVSIPSGDEENYVVVPPPSPAPAALSPLPELHTFLLRLRLGPASPLSPSPSLPDLVPLESPILNHQQFLANDAVQVNRSPIPRVPTPYPHRNRMPVLAPVPQLALRDPRRASPAYAHLLQRTNFASGSQTSRANSIAFHAHRNTRRGNSRPLSRPNPKVPKVKSQKSRRRAKRCYECHSEWHLVAACPALNFRVD
ncbi:hypothetical protein R3P38DRAFT_3259291 [Favolaschia claudopus]|uniref:Uncharacterized protein n=1 Tax=Favolaschia claudopus TaxID=2862362 RepID=A0AAW0CTN5_9AGAR